MINLIFKKDLKLFFSNKKAVVLTFLIPILLISLFAFAFGGTNTSNKPKQLKLLYVDSDQSNFSQSIIKDLNSIAELKLIIIDKNEGLTLLKKGKEVAMLTIEKGFQDSVKFSKKLPIVLNYDSS